jgi:hypothetical protein
MRTLNLDEQNLIAWFRTRNTVHRLALQIFIRTGRADLALILCQPLGENLHSFSGIPMAKGI